MASPRMRATLLVAFAVLLVVASVLLRPRVSRLIAGTPRGPTAVPLLADPPVLPPAEPAPTGAMAGRVLDAKTGKPLAGVQVTAGQGAQTGHAVTDAHGRYRVEGVPVGEGGVDASDDRRGFVHGGAGPLMVLAGQTLKVPDIRLKRGGWVAGRVELPAESTPGSRRGWWLTAESRGPRRHLWYVSVAQPIARDGTFRSAPLLPGIYSVRLSSSPLMGQHLPGSQTWADEVTAVRVKAGHQTAVTLRPRLEQASHPQTGQPPGTASGKAPVSAAGEGEVRDGP